MFIAHALYYTSKYTYYTQSFISSKFVNALIPTYTIFA
jgi:hypothetical protein